MRTTPQHPHSHLSDKQTPIRDWSERIRFYLWLAKSGMCALFAICVHVRFASETDLLPHSYSFCFGSEQRFPAPYILLIFVLIHYRLVCASFLYVVKKKKKGERWCKVLMCDCKDDVDKIVCKYTTARNERFPDERLVLFVPYWWDFFFFCRLVVSFPCLTCQSDFLQFENRNYSLTDRRYTLLDIYTIVSRSMFCVSSASWLVWTHCNTLARYCCSLLAFFFFFFFCTCAYVSIWYMVFTNFKQYSNESLLLDHAMASCGPNHFPRVTLPAFRRTSATNVVLGSTCSDMPSLGCTGIPKQSIDTRAIWTPKKESVSKTWKKAKKTKTHIETR